MLKYWTKGFCKVFCVVVLCWACFQKKKKMERGVDGWCLANPSYFRFLDFLKLDKTLNYAYNKNDFITLSDISIDLKHTWNSKRGNKEQMNIQEDLKTCLSI